MISNALFFCLNGFDINTITTAFVMEKVNIQGLTVSNKRRYSFDDNERDEL